MHIGKSYFSKKALFWYQTALCKVWIPYFDFAQFFGILTTVPPPPPLGMARFVRKLKPYLNVVKAVLIGVVSGAFDVKRRERQPQIFSILTSEKPLTIQLFLVVAVPIGIQTLKIFSLKWIILTDFFWWRYEASKKASSKM